MSLKHNKNAVETLTILLQAMSMMVYVVNERMDISSHSTSFDSLKMHWRVHEAKWRLGLNWSGISPCAAVEVIGSPD